MSPARPLLLALLLAGCDAEEPGYSPTKSSTADTAAGPPADDARTGDGGLYAVVSLVQRACVDCHSATPSEAGVDALAAYGQGAAPIHFDPAVFCETMAAEDMIDFDRIEDGLLYSRLAQLEQPMPPDGPLSSTELRVVRDWIDGGALCSSAVGAVAYREQCAGCHGTEGEGMTAPALGLVLDGHDQDTVSDIILNGTGDMPPVAVDAALADELARYVVDAWGR